MPFAGYKNFDACVAANKDRKDAAAYCATIMRRTEKPKGDHPMEKPKGHMPMDKSLFAPVFKTANIAHTDHNQVFGWASVVITKEGSIVDDLQGHTIPVPELEAAAYEFVKTYRTSGERHMGPDQGILIESMVFTPEKLARMGLAKGALPVGWWVGFQMPPPVFAKVKSGQYKMFSIQGAARLVPVE